MTRKELLLYTLQNQFLLEKGSTQEVISGLCGLQAQFANNPRESLRIRAGDFSETAWNNGLLKIWTHRNTIHVVRKEELGLFLSAKGGNGPWRDGPSGFPAASKRYWASFIRDKVAGGVDMREPLKAACRQAGMDETAARYVFDGWGGLIKEMSDRGLIAYAPGTEKRFVLPEEPGWMDRDAARRILLERYFTHFGPATVEDCAAFTGYRVKEVWDLLRKSGLPFKSVNGGGTVYFYLGALHACRSLPACVYLSGFDQMILGYKDRSRCLDPSDKLLAVNAAGIVYPGVLLYGRLCARWKKMPGKLQIEPFRPLSRTAQALAAAKGRRLFAGERVAVSFLPPCRP